MGNRIVHLLAVVIQADTAKDTGFYPVYKGDSLAGDGTKLLTESFRLRRGKAYRGHSGDRQDVVIQIVMHPVSPAAIGKMTGITLLGKNFQEIQYIRVHFSPEAGVNDLTPFLFAQAGRPEKPQKFRLFPETFVQHGQLRKDLGISSIGIMVGEPPQQHNEE